MNIVWTVQAVRDLRHVRHFIADTNPEAAADVAKRILEATERLSSFPASGRPGRLPDTRELVITGSPFFLPYRVVGGEVQILAVIHAARQWP